MAEKRVSFTGVDNGVSNMIQKLRKDSERLGKDMLQDAQKYARSQREQLRIVEDQIRAIERRNKLDREGQELQARMQLQRSQMSSSPLARQQGETAFKTEMGRIAIESKEDKIQTRILRDLLENRRKDLGIKEKTGGAGAMSFFKALLGMEILRGIGSTIQGIPQTRGVNQMATPILTLEGMAAGGITGAGVGAVAGALQTGLGGTAIGLGALKGLQVGSVIGKEVGSFVGNAFSRHLSERESFLGSRNKLIGVAGRNVNLATGLSGLGLSDAESIALQTNIARTRGRVVEGDVQKFRELEKGAGLDQGTLFSSLQTGRITRQDALKDLENLYKKLGKEGVFAGDRTIFGEIIQKQNEIVGQLGKTTEVVNTAAVRDTMLRVSRLGGMFNVRDPRSMANLMALQQGVTNPQNEFLQAATFADIRRTNPNADIFDIMEIQEQGVLQNPELLQQIVQSTVRRGGGSRTAQLMALRARFPKLPLASVRRLFEQRGKLGEMTPEQLAKELDVDFADEARKNVTRQEKSQAEIANAFKNSFIDGIDTVKDHYKAQMIKVNEEIARRVKNILNDADEDRRQAEEDRRILKEGVKTGKVTLPPGTVMLEDGTIVTREQAKMFEELDKIKVD